MFRPSSSKSVNFFCKQSNVIDDTVFWQEKQERGSLWKPDHRKQREMKGTMYQYQMKPEKIFNMFQNTLVY